MPQSMPVRAASLGASMIVLGGLLVAALSVRYVLRDLPVVDGPVIDIFRPADPPPPPATPDEPQIQHPRLSSIIEDTLLPADASLARDTVLESVPGGGIAGPALDVVTNPVWLRRPRDLAGYYPRRAIQAEVQGNVTLDCRVGVDGRLACAVVSETPADWGFGEAALRIARDHRMRPALRDGAPVEARYVMRVPFTLE